MILLQKTGTFRSFVLPTERIGYMSKQEQAISILKRFSDVELDRFIAYFGIIYPAGESNDMEERRAAFERMKRVCRYIPDLDEKKELEEYRKERFGV